jgi:hypothetical protein
MCLTWRSTSCTELKTKESPNQSHLTFSPVSFYLKKWVQSGGTSHGTKKSKMLSTNRRKGYMHTCALQISSKYLVDHSGLCAQFVQPAQRKQTLHHLTAYSTTDHMKNKQTKNKQTKKNKITHTHKMNTKTMKEKK